MVNDLLPDRDSNAGPGCGGTISLGLDCHASADRRCSLACLLYDPSVSSDLWVGALTTLAGAVLGGAISYVLSRQQIKDARLQRAEEFTREKQRRSADRRFEAYADFLTKARSFRNAIRRYGDNFDPDFTPAAIDSIGREAHAASALVFLVVESIKTYDICRTIITTMSLVQGFLHDFGPESTDDPWLGLNNEMARLLREFQVAAREELDIGGVDRTHMLGLTRNSYSVPPS